MLTFRLLLTYCGIPVRYKTMLLCWSSVTAAVHSGNVIIGYDIRLLPPANQKTHTYFYMSYAFPSRPKRKHPLRRRGIGSGGGLDACDIKVFFLATCWCSSSILMFSLCKTAVYYSITWLHAITAFF
jgi:hypothetical protein